MKHSLVFLSFLACACGGPPVYAPNIEVDVASTSTVVISGDMPQLKARDCPPDSGRIRAIGDEGPLAKTIILPPVLLGPPVTGDQPMPLVHWRDPDEVPRVVGIHVQPLKIDSNTNIRHRAYAQIAWGAGGAKFKVNVDLMSGISLSLFASTVEIAAVNESEGAVGPVVEDSQIPVMGSISPEGPLNSNMVPRRSFSSAGGVGGTLITIPAFATELDVQHAGAAAAYSIQFKQDGGVVIAQFDVQATDSMPPRPIPIPNDAFEVLIDSGGTNIGRTEAIFYLGL